MKDMEDLVEILVSRRVVVSLIIVFVSIVVYMILSRLIRKLLSIKLKGVRFNDRRHKTTISLMDNIVKYFIAIVAFVMILDLWGIDTKSLLASLGVVSLVAGLALQDFLKDIIAGMTILFEDQYAVGDVVTIGEFKGTVTYLGIKTTRLKSFTGETLIIANRNIDRVINHSLETSVTFMDVSVSYGTNLDKAKEVLNKVCSDLNKELKLREPAKVCGVQDLGTSSVDIRISFGCVFAEKIKTEQIFRERIKKELDKNDIEIPFTQVVIHNGK